VTTLRSLLPVLACLAGCERSGPLPAAGEAHTVPVEEVVAQLEGRHCRFGVGALDSCQPRPPRGLLGWLLTRSEDRWTCPTGAARCLAKMGPSASAAVPALLRALESGPGDYDTGDGVIPVRSAVIDALGKSGDARAVLPLVRALSEPAYAFPVLEALRDLGPLAQGHADTVASVLTARIADTEGRAQACARAIQQLEYRLAIQAVADRLQREHPEQTHFVIPPAEQEAAMHALDRTSPDSVRAREGACRDIVADAAVGALAAMGCERCLGRVVEALGEPLVAQSAAWALTNEHPLPPGAEEALREVLSSGRHGRLAVDAADTALRFPRKRRQQQ